MKHSIELKPGESVVCGPATITAVSGTFHREASRPTVPCLVLEVEVLEPPGGALTGHETAHETSAAPESEEPAASH